MGAAKLTRQQCSGTCGDNDTRNKTNVTVYGREEHLFLSMIVPMMGWGLSHKAKKSTTHLCTCQEINYTHTLQPLNM